MLLLTLLLGCPSTSSSTTFDPTCTVAIAIEGAAAVSVGDTVTLVGTPFTRSADTVVRVGGVDVGMPEIVREGCDDCDACGASSCLACLACTTCEEPCATCVERARFVVPALAPGEYAVVMANGVGVSDPAFLVVVPGDTDAGDTDG